MSYSGKIVDLLPKAKQVVTELKNHGLQQAILLPSRVSGRDLALPDVPERLVSLAFSVLGADLTSGSFGSRSTTLSAFLKTGGSGNTPLVFEQLSFSQPLFILYSSGTSGKPKCIVHTAGVSVSFPQLAQLAHGTS